MKINLSNIDIENRKKDGLCFILSHFFVVSFVIHSARIKWASLSAFFSYTIKNKVRFFPEKLFSDLTMYLDDSVYVRKLKLKIKRRTTFHLRTIYFLKLHLSAIILNLKSSCFERKPAATMTVYDGTQKRVVPRVCIGTCALQRRRTIR